MTRTRQTLGLSLAAVLILIATVAAPASAVQIHSSSSSGKTYFESLQVGANQFDFANGATMKCILVGFEGQYSGTTASSLTANFLLGSCKHSGQMTTVSTTGCDLVFNTPSGSGFSYNGTTSINCSAGNSIKITVGDPGVSCTITIGPQTPTGLVDYLNSFDKSGLSDITVKWTLTGIAYTSTGSVCGPNGNANLTGESTVTGFSNASLETYVDLWIA